jgi:hypothetical protein
MMRGNLTPCMASEGTKVFHALILAESYILGPEPQQYELARTALEVMALQDNPVDKIDHYLKGHVCIALFA